jgi:IMP cyclohydrolase
MKHLENNTYPGRGIILGKTKDASKIIQIYWIMGRSENSRNRVFASGENNFVKTEAFDISKLTDPSLIIYYPVKEVNGYHIVTNGDQTETIYKFIGHGRSFEEAVAEQLYEPDKPNFTARISGIANVSKKEYKLSIVKAVANEADYFTRQIFAYNDFKAGEGYCITTYKTDGNPLPCFSGEPVPAVIYNSINENLEKYWDLLDKDNRVSLLVKSVDVKYGSIEIKIKNTHN